MLGLTGFGAASALNTISRVAVSVHHRRTSIHQLRSEGRLQLQCLASLRNALAHTFVNLPEHCFVIAPQPVQAGVAQLHLQQPVPGLSPQNPGAPPPQQQPPQQQGRQQSAGGAPAGVTAGGQAMTPEEQGQFMRRKAAEKAADMRRSEVLLLETRHDIYHIDVVGKGHFMRRRPRGRPPRCGATRFGPTKCI